MRARCSISISVRFVRKAMFTSVYDRCLCCRAFFDRFLFRSPPKALQLIAFHSVNTTDIFTPLPTANDLVRTVLQPVQTRNKSHASRFFFLRNIYCRRRNISDRRNIHKTQQKRIINPTGNYTPGN